jgi:hypothetical protein
MHDVIPFGVESGPDGAGDLEVVFDDQHAHSGHAWFGSQWQDQAYPLTRVLILKNC